MRRPKRCWRTVSTWRCGCCTPSCLSLLRRCGKNDPGATVEGERDTIVRLAQLESLAFDGAPGKGVGAHAVFGDGSEVVVALEGSIDVQQECRRLSDELGRLDNQLRGLAARLTNERFVSRAPMDVVAQEREKAKAWRDQRGGLDGSRKSLGSP